MSIPDVGWIREKALLDSGAVPYGRTKLRQEVAAGRFPAPRLFAPRVVAYDAVAVRAWIAQQREERPIAAGGTGSPVRTSYKAATSK